MEPYLRSFLDQKNCPWRFARFLGLGSGPHRVDLKPVVLGITRRHRVPLATMANSLRPLDPVRSLPVDSPRKIYALDSLSLRIECQNIV
jgi:hypothetical protein